MDLVWLAALTFWLSVSNWSQLSDYTDVLQLYNWLVKNKAADAPIAFKEIEMVMIDQINDSGPLHEIYE